MLGWLGPCRRLAGSPGADEEPRATLACDPPPMPSSRPTDTPTAAAAVARSATSAARATGPGPDIRGEKVVKSKIRGGRA